MRKPTQYYQPRRVNCPEFMLTPDSDCGGYRTLHFHQAHQGHLHKKDVDRLIKYLTRVKEWLNTGPKPE